MRVLVIALVLVAAPVSLAYFVVLFSAQLAEFGLVFVETIGKAQLVALLWLSPLILLERLITWARRRGLI